MRSLSTSFFETEKLEWLEKSEALITVSTLPGMVDCS